MILTSKQCLQGVKLKKYVICGIFYKNCRPHIELKRRLIQKENKTLHVHCTWVV